MTAFTMERNGDGYHFHSGEYKLPCVFTLQTDERQVKVFYRLLNKEALQTLKMLQEYYDRRQWNFDHPGEGKLWPIFSKMERHVKQLQKLAGIQDT